VQSMRCRAVIRSLGSLRTLFSLCQSKSKYRPETSPVWAGLSVPT